MYFEHEMRGQPPGGCWVVPGPGAQRAGCGKSGSCCRGSARTARRQKGGPVFTGGARLPPGRFVDPADRGQFPAEPDASGDLGCEDGNCYEVRGVDGEWWACVDTTCYYLIPGGVMAITTTTCAAGACP